MIETEQETTTITATDNLAIARRYLEAIENGAEAGVLADFFTKDVVQEEFPNRLSPIGQHRNLQALLDSARKGKKTISRQKYDVLNAIADGDRVAIEVFWSGLLAVPLEGLPANSQLRAHVSIFLEFRDGKIARQHNYDCFDPWWV
jgi:ketosteroid isomerase-like protein